MWAPDFDRFGVPDWPDMQMLGQNVLLLDRGNVVLALIRWAVVSRQSQCSTGRVQHNTWMVPHSTVRYCPGMHFASHHTHVLSDLLLSDLLLSDL
jgi:hypothetical protein